MNLIRFQRDIDLDRRSPAMHSKGAEEKCNCLFGNPNIVGPADNCPIHKPKKMTRKEHLEWAKERALEYVDMNDVSNAYGSFVSDLGKHEELAGHPAIELGMQLMLSRNLNTPDEMRKFINDTN